MKEQRLIRVIGTQRDAQGEEGKIELVTEGKFYNKNNSLYLVYEETEVSGMAGATTRLKIEGKDRVSMKRFGTTMSQLIFEEKKSFTSQYNTQFGDFEMSVFTKKLQVNISDDGKSGNIEIHYNILIKGFANTSNTLRIEYS